MDNTPHKIDPSRVELPPWRTELEKQVFIIQMQTLVDAINDPRITDDALRALALSMVEPRQ